MRHVPQHFGSRGVGVSRCAGDIAMPAIERTMPVKGLLFASLDCLIKDFVCGLRARWRPLCVSWLARRRRKNLRVPWPAAGEKSRHQRLSFSRHQRLPSFLFLCPSSTSPLFFFSYVAAGITSQESRLSYEYSSSERLARAGRHPPSTRPLLCRCVVAPPRILSLTKCRRPLSSHICTCLLSARAGKAVTLPRRFEIVRPFTGLRKAAWPRKSSPAPASQPASLPQ